MIDVGVVEVACPSGCGEPIRVHVEAHGPAPVDDGALEVSLSVPDEAMHRAYTRHAALRHQGP